MLHCWNVLPILLCYQNLDLARLQVGEFFSIQSMDVARTGSVKWDEEDMVSSSFTVGKSHLGNVVRADSQLGRASGKSTASAYKVSAFMPSSTREISFAVAQSTISHRSSWRVLSTFALRGFKLFFFMCAIL